MSKRWTAWPRGIRWLVGAVVAVVLVLAIAWVLFVPAADWLAHHDIGSTKGPLLQTARDAARGRLLTLGAGLFAAAALVFTALNFNLLRQTSEKTDQWQKRTHEQTEQGQVTDRYTKAIDQLGSSTVDVTIGGIYALERIAHDSPIDHPTVMEVLAACIRENSGKPLHEPTDGPDKPEPVTRPDTQAAVTVIARRDTKLDRRPINLRRVHLPGADLLEAKLSAADLTGATLYDADLTDADLTGAKLPGANLAGANLTDAKLVAANLTRANLTGAKLTGATFIEEKPPSEDLTGASPADASLEFARAVLAGANLTRAELSRVDLPADLTGINLVGANLTDAKLIGAKLAGADLTDADLTDAIIAHADLGGAKWPEGAQVPAGWGLIKGSGRLERRIGASGSGPAAVN